MGRIIYKGLSVSHIYLWVTIGIWSVPVSGSLASRDSLSFVRKRKRLNRSSGD
jgi:hypothetical protein